MASTYTSNTGIEKIGTGEQSGTWGTTTNLNLDIIDRAINGVGTITLSGTTHTLTTSDGTLSDGMFKVLVLSGSPSGTNTITISPNDAQKFYVVINNSGESAIFTQGSGGDATVANGVTKLIYADGGEAAAQVVDLSSTLVANTLNTLNIVDDTTPELGGNLQSNGNDIVMADNDKVLLGTGSDGELFHDGSNTIINDAGTGSLKLQQGGSDKLEVTATGVTITGTAIATTDTDTSNTGSVTLDFEANQNFVLTLTGNVTLANPTTEQVGQSGFIVFIQDATGGRTVSLGTDYETAGGAGLTLSSAASTTDIVPYVVAASGRILLGAPQLAFA